MESFNNPVNPQENTEVKASQICYGFVNQVREGLDNNHVTGNELEKQMADFCRSEAEKLRKGENTKIFPTTGGEVELTPELKEEMVKWYEGSAEFHESNIKQESPTE